MHVLYACIECIPLNVCYRQSKYYFISASLLEVFLASYAECRKIILATMHSEQYALNLMHSVTLCPF